MKWIDSSHTLPKHNHEVLVHYDGRHDLAIFDKYEKGFRLRSGVFLHLEKQQLYWAELIRP